MLHCVYFWLKDDLSAEEIEKFEREVQTLKEIDVVRRGFVGTPAPTPDRPVTDHSFSYFLQLEFESVDDHNIYQDHPDHHRFVESCRDFWTKVKVYDSQPV